MLLTQLLIQHPEAIIDIVRGTPAWVGALLAALLVLALFFAPLATTAALKISLE